MAEVGALFLAIEAGNAAQVKDLVADGIPLDTRIDLLEGMTAFFRGLTPLMFACLVPGVRADVVRVLLDSGANPSATSEAEIGALWYAASAGMWPQSRPDPDLATSYPGDYGERLRLLLAAGASANETASNGRSALGEACSVGDPERVRLLLQAGATPRSRLVTISKSQREEDRAQLETVPQVAARAPRRRLSRFVAHRPATGEFTNAFQIPLFQAAEAGCAECLRMILDAGGVATEKDVHHRTALFYATTPEVVRLLLEHGAYRQDRDLYYHTPLQSALANRAFWVATAMLTVSNELDARTDGWTYLQRASYERDAEAIDAFVAAGANPRLPTNDGGTALHLAAWRGDGSSDTHPFADVRKVVRQLVDAGADLEARDKLGGTPLHEATGGDEPSPDATWALLQQGADPNARNLDGRTPLMVAAEEGSVECVRILLAAGADPHIRDRSLKAALEYAETTLRSWKGLDRIARIVRRKRSDLAARALERAEEVVKLLKGEA